MKPVTKILLTWLVLVAFFVISLIFLPHSKVHESSLLIYSIQALLLIQSFWIVRREPVKKNKYLFVNFALFFSLSVPFHLNNFVGRNCLVDDAYLRLYIDQFLGLGAYYLFMSIAIVYVAVDALFRDFKVFHKYLVTLAIAGGFFAYYYSPYFVDPLHGHHTAEILDWKTLEESYTAYTERFGLEPAPEVLSASTEMYSWNHGQKSGILFSQEANSRTAELYPYLTGDNYKVLVFRPLYMNGIYMSVLCIAFVLLFFGYQYMKDPPQGAYIEKIMFLLLVFSSMEIFHAWAAVKTIEWKTFSDLWWMGHYVSVFLLLLISVFFALRLRFITSVKGEFYEQELVTSPTAITRWRDTLDNLVIEKFFNRKLLLGRMLVDPSDK